MDTNPYLLTVTNTPIPWFSWTVFLVAVVIAIVVMALVAGKAVKELFDQEPTEQVLVAAVVALGLVSSVGVSGLWQAAERDAKYESAPEQAVMAAWPDQLDPAIMLNPVDLTRSATATVSRANLPDCTVERLNSLSADQVQTFTLDCGDGLVKPLRTAVTAP